MRTDLGHRAGRHALTLPATYAIALEAELENVRAMAAARRTYGDDFRLDDEIERLLEWVRPAIRKSERELRTERARAKRRSARWPDWDLSFERRAIARLEANLRAERAYRDELVEGARYRKAEDRKHARDAAALRADLGAHDARVAAERAGAQVPRAAADR